ncbi:MAG TPA: hypothetical protein VL992_08330 [Tepidisphaeraceae bacterium]|nr:hypothetical protein [Tepidisphaeraceae bacterium]
MYQATKFLLIGFAATVLLGGCAQQDCSFDSVTFAPDAQPKASDRLYASQAAAGAASDATLYPCHFSGTKLNSLGAAKLDDMLEGASGGSLKVWMAVADDDLAEARRVAVGVYLRDHGVALEQIEFGDGANPTTLHSAAKGLADLPKADSTGDDSGGASSASTTGGGAMSGGLSSSTPGASAGAP